jgi:hypothetical protein
MTDNADRGTRWRLVRDVVVFQVKLGMEAVLDLATIPTSLAAAALDLLLGNWRRPRFFHAVLRFGERCESWIDLWGAATPGAEEPRAGVDAVMQSIETVIRDPRTGPTSLRTLRRWAAMKLLDGTGDVPQHPDRRDDAPT